MESVLLVLLPGVIGGLLLALLIALRPRRAHPTFVSRRLEAPSPALINMAHIRVEGLGGLGLVAAVIAVAIADSRIRMAIIIAAILGTVVALALIAMRRETGALPSGGNGPDDRSLLHLGAPKASTSGADAADGKRRAGPPGRLTLRSA